MTSTQTFTTVTWELSDSDGTRVHITHRPEFATVSTEVRDCEGGWSDQELAFWPLADAAGLGDPDAVPGVWYRVPPHRYSGRLTAYRVYVDVDRARWPLAGDAFDAAREAAADRAASELGGRLVAGWDLDLLTWIED